MKDKLKLRFNFTFLIILVVVAAVLVNLIATTLESKLPLKIDFSSNKAFQLSEETIEVLKTVDRDINIYHFVTKGNESLYVKQTVDMYKGYNNKIHFEQIDPSHDPVFAKNLGVEVAENSIIVKCGDKVRTIDSSKMYDSTYEQYGITEFKLEQKLTLAIDYVLREEDTNILFTKGHEEAGYKILKTSLEDENAEASEIDLKTTDIPEGTSAIYIISPQRDFSADEVVKIQKYLEAGGSLNISIDYDTTSTNVLRQYLREYWGINYKDNIILETDQKKYYSNNPYILIPEYGEHDIMSKIKTGNINMFWPNTRSIEITEKPGVTTNVLLMTSEKAIAKPSSKAGEVNVTEGDTTGQANLAVAAEYINSSAKTRTRIIATGSSFYLMYLQEASVANADFVRESLNYLRGEESSKSISVTPKNVFVKQLTLTESQKTTYTYIYGVLPAVIVLAAGLIVWLRRRHK